jgi:hypothetical protein
MSDSLALAEAVGASSVRKGYLPPDADFLMPGHQESGACPCARPRNFAIHSG